MATLSKTQQALHHRAQEVRAIVEKRGEHFHGIYVQGPTYRTAASLERMGMGTVQYQGPSRGWYADTPAT